MFMTIEGMFSKFTIKKRVCLNIQTHNMGRINQQGIGNPG